LITQLQQWVDETENPISSASQKALSPPDGKIIRLRFLCNLTQGKTHLIKSLLKDFLLIEQEFVHSIDQWLLFEDCSKLAGVTHKFMGSISLVGLESMEPALRQLEQQLKSGKQASRITELCRNLKQFCQDFEKELAEEISWL
jgi:HPt (histidine-containing phosphotransfer) domain-containing protein